MDPGGLTFINSYPIEEAAGEAAVSPPCLQLNAQLYTPQVEEACERTTQYCLLLLLIDLVETPRTETSIVVVASVASGRPRWLGTWSACLSRSMPWVQVSPSRVHARTRDFFLHQKLISGKRESAS